MRQKKHLIVIIKTFFLATSLICHVGCKKYIAVQAPYTSTNSLNVYTDDANATAAMTGMYSRMSASPAFFGSSSLNLFAGLSADELTLYSGVTTQNYVAYYTNSLVANSVQNYGSEYWSGIYNYIYACNAAVEGLSDTSSNLMTPSVKRQVLGEAKFMRAFFYFYLVTLYGDVPLVTTTDYVTNNVMGRTPQTQVYKLMIDDLTDAEALLSSDFLDGKLQKYATGVTPERVRPTKWAAAALLARVNLFAGYAAAAESQATLVIDNAAMFGLASVDSVFLKNNNEAIWQLQPVLSSQNTQDAISFILAPGGPTNNTSKPVYLSSQLINSFEAGDKRRIIGKWVNSITLTGVTYYYPYKYKNITATVTEYETILRLGELFLIRAEARDLLNNISGAKADLNMVRARAGLAGTLAADKTSLQAAILHERQVELFTEWATRWLDLKRTGSVDAVMSVVTPIKSNGLVSWNSYQQLYPIYFNDILKDPNLKQNNGY